MKKITRTLLAVLFAFTLALVPFTANAQTDVQAEADGVELTISEVNLDGPSIEDVTVTITNGTGEPVKKGDVTFSGPINWTVYPDTQKVKAIRPGGSAEVTFQIRVPEQRDAFLERLFSATVTYEGGDGAGTASVERTQQSGTPPTVPTGTVFASDFDWLEATNGYGSIGQDISNSGSAIKLNGQTFEKGLGVHAASDIRYYTGGKCTSFTAKVGVDDYQATLGSVVFSVLADDKELVKTPVMGATTETATIDVDISGATYVTLSVDDGGDGINYDHADWADAKFTCAG
ncbi:hypothetical protein GCM10027403_07450 [Arthrobacter tecti]